MKKPGGSCGNQRIDSQNRKTYHECQPFRRAGQAKRRIGKKRRNDNE